MILASGVWLRIAIDLRDPHSGVEACGLVLLLLTVAANLALVVRGRRSSVALAGLVVGLNFACLLGALFLVYAISSVLRTFH